MRPLKQLIESKRPLVSVRPDDTVFAALALLAQFNIGALPVMATGLAFTDRVLRWRFPGNVRNTVQDLEREQANPHLLEALRGVLPGLAGMTIAYDVEPQARPEDILRADPNFQRMLAETGGEIVDVRRPD